MLKIDAIPAFKDNYIWFIQAQGSQQLLIVDPGDAEPVITAIERQGLVPVAILITHGCHDHVDGIERLLKRYDIPVYGPKNEFIPHISHPLGACDDLVINAHFPSLRVLDIPGHTAGHIGFLIEDCLFCGDALFGAGCGRLHSGPADVLFQSLQQIAQLPLDTRVYCAHEYTQANLRFAAEIEPDNKKIQQRLKHTEQLRQRGLPSLPSHIALELDTNPFLRCDNEQVKKAAEQWSAQPLETKQQVFTAVRKWKDGF